MANDDIFESAIRSKGDLAGVYEYDGETGYFYLYQTGANGNKVIAAIHILSEDPDFVAKDVTIRWDKEGECVGLFIRTDLWAVFDTRDQAKYGGDYQAGKPPDLPAHASIGFDH